MAGRSSQAKTSQHCHKVTIRSFSVVVAVSLAILGIHSSLPGEFSWGLQPALAQQVKPDEVWQEVYQQVPDLPKENQYVSNKTGKVAEDNTLVGRLVRYHLYVKGRLPNYRFDWKLTLADYLGANELMQESVYPGADTLQQNPFENDRAAIRRLTLAQRQALVQSLVNIFDPRSATSSQSPQQPVANPQTSTQPTSPGKPASGADLLKF
jgi:hypothetical protein